MDNAIGLYNQGAIAYITGKLDLAISFYQKSLELDPQNAYLRILLGHMYSELKQYHKTIENYEKSIELDPKF